MKLTTLTGFFKTCFNSNLRIQKTQKPLNNDFSLFIGFFFLLLTVFSPKLMSQNIQGVAPVLFPPGGLAIDGNAYVKFPGDPTTPNPPFPSGDWLFERGAPNNDVIPGGVFPFTVSDPVSEGFPEGELSDDFYVYPDLTTFFRDNITNNDPTIFTSRNKINDNPNTYTWGSGSSPNKNEIQNAVAHFSFADPNLPHGNEGDLWMMFFADRQVVNGSSYIDFEVLQNSLTITGTTSGGFISAAPPGAGGRTPGDILVTIEFTNGGLFANVVTRRWTLVNGTYSYQVFTPDPGTIFGTNNTAQTIVPYQIYNQDPLESGEFEGFWQYSLNQWAEGAVNLTAFFDQDPCFSISTLFIRTRTSGSSGQSELKDFPGKPLQLTLDLTPSVEIAKSDVTCYGEADGVVSIVEASGYDRLDLFKVVGNQDGVGNNEMDDTPEGSNTDGSDFTGLSPGSYYVVAVRENGEVECPAISNVVIITEPDALNLILTPTNASCFGDVKSISAAITGTPLSDLEINIDGGDFQNVVASPVVFNNLTAAEHTIILRRKSNNDCSEERKVTLTEPDELDLELSATNAACFGEAKSISAAITGAPLSDLEINIDGGAFANVAASPVVFNNLSAGEHTVILRRKSDNACLVSKDLTLSEPDKLDLVLTPTNASCFGDAKSISAAITGTPLSDLEINIDGGDFEDVIASPVVFNNLTAAEHTIILRRKSNNDCSEERKVTLTEPDELDLELSATNAACFGEAKSISAAITGTPFSDLEINIDGGAFADVVASPVVFHNLTAEKHTVILRRKSDNACLVSEDLTLSEPDALDLVLTPTDATCFGVSNGSISAAITGTPLSDLEINIDGGAFANVTASPVIFDNLSAAEHTIILRRKSNNDCSEERKVTLAEPDELGLILTPTDATCEDSNKSISAAITGTPLSDIEINIDGGTFATVLASPVVFDGLTVGSHTVIIRRISDNDCFVSESATVNDPTNCLAEGCTLGYWKEHTDRWCSSYTTCMLYEDIFTSAPNQFKNADLTLLQALNLGGGGIFNLARQSVAALLNICHDDVAYNYPGGEAQLIIDVNNAYLGIGAFDAGAKATQLDGLNNAGCPLGGSSATTAPSEGCINGASAALISSDSNLFTAYPVPFKDALNVQYDFDYSSAANIQIFDLQGRMLRSYTEANAHKGKVTQLSIDFRTNANQVYILKVTTDRDVFTKKIISDK